MRSIVLLTLINAANPCLSLGVERHVDLTAWWFNLDCWDPNLMPCFAQLLLQIFNQLLTAPQQTPEVATYIKLVAKVFWSTTYMGIPDLLLQPEMFNGWMTALLTAVGQQLPESVQPASHEDRASSPWWKSRKWIFHITYRLYSRYSVPKHCKEGNDRKFSELFSREYSVRFLDAHLAVLAGLANGAYLSPRVTNLVIQYISVATNIKAAYKCVVGMRFFTMLEAPTCRH